MPGCIPVHVRACACARVRVGSLASLTQHRRPGGVSLLLEICENRKRVVRSSSLFVEVVVVLRKPSPSDVTEQVWSSRLQLGNERKTWVHRKGGGILAPQSTIEKMGRPHRLNM